MGKRVSIGSTQIPNVGRSIFGCNDADGEDHDQLGDVRRGHPPPRVGGGTKVPDADQGRVGADDRGR